MSVRICDLCNLFDNFLSMSKSRASLCCFASSSNIIDLNIIKKRIDFLKKDLDNEQSRELYLFFMNEIIDYINNNK